MSIDQVGKPSKSKKQKTTAAPTPTSTSAAKPNSKFNPSHSFHTLAREEAFKNPANTNEASSSEQANEPTFGTREIHNLVQPHISSFNAIFSGLSAPVGDEPPVATKGLLDLAVEDLEKIPVCIYNITPQSSPETVSHKLEFKIDSVTISRPMMAQGGLGSAERRVFPSEARESLSTYSSQMAARVSWRVDGQRWEHEMKNLGKLPVMVKSARCHLHNYSPAEMVEHHEEAQEMGGYFIINGNERLIRFLIVPRRNHVTALIRPSFQNRGKAYTPYGVTIRGVRKDESGLTNTLHYLSNGGATIRFSWRKNEYMIPLVMVLKALTGATDQEIFHGIYQNENGNTFLTDRIELLLRGFKIYGLKSQNECLSFLGSRFRVVLSCPDEWDDAEVGRFLLDRVLLVHLDEPVDKYRLLLFMVRKLYSLVRGDCCADNPDSPQHQEILMPGFLYNTIIKEKLHEFLVAIRAQVAKDLRKPPPGMDFTNNKYVQSVIRKTNGEIGHKLEYFLSTGNLVSPSGLDLQQAAGYTIVGEKLNFTRYISHFRSVHRGSFFAELKTTTVRKLLPEAWGFLCPVHTPDGSPCGLLNHFAHQCRLIHHVLDASKLPGLLLSLGMTDVFNPQIDGGSMNVVMLDGKIIGWARPSLCIQMANTLRLWKTEKTNNVPLDLEIGLVPISKGGQYPGLYLFSTRSRMMRDVKYLKNDKLDSIGPFEQVYLDIACMDEEIEKAVTSHQEVAPTHVLSLLANLTPFSDFNQSPRNMYQCQMSKQTMGTPSTVISHRTDNKLYRLQTGQTPIVRPKLHNKYGMDAFPNGTNAIVAVISYTGYDMEDAMILNKSAQERGFGYGSIYKSHIVDLASVKALAGSGSTPDVHFGLGPDVLSRTQANEGKRAFIDDDGLPYIGLRVKAGDPICGYVDRTDGRTKFEKYKGDEEGYIDQVRLIGGDGSAAEAKKLHIKLRIPRSPAIGDKFSSRHGQKGVCSQKYPAIDMPFSESGIQPDVIINPHAFPSRMTIGMFVESLAGKAGAMHGLAQDGTPFNFSEDDTPINYFGEQLRKAGYNYYGNEPMYSGITGQEFGADIYIGVVYYQRLRHMVGDKWQVRTTGPIDQVTRQPVKGRKRGGGIRFGEMERDALLAHGTSYLLQDRLMNCSDYSTCWVCRTCGSMISIGYENTGASREIGFGEPIQELASGPMGEYCRVCRGEVEARNRKLGEFRNQEDKVQSTDFTEGELKGGDLEVVAVPFVFRLLVSELAAMGIRMRIGID